MAYIQKIKTKKGIAHRVVWSLNGIKQKKYFPATIPFPIVKQFAGEREAQKHEKEYLAPRRLKIADLLKKFEEQRKSDIATWRHRIALNHLIEFTGEIYTDKITPEVIHGFRDWLLERRKGADPQKIRRGINHDLRHIRVIFRWAYKQGIISSHPFDRVQMFKTSKPDPDVLTVEELNRIRLCLSKKDRLTFHFLRFTGLRIGEACAVRIKDIDLIADEIHLHQTKNGTEETIMLHRNLKRLAEKTKWLVGDKNDKVIKVTHWTITHRFRKAMRAAGVNKKMTTHILRHTAGRRILEAYYTTGNAKAIAKKFLRHKTDVMTEHYQQSYLEDLKKAMKDVKL